jgi:soluble lytic murein transglycosylase
MAEPRPAHHSPLPIALPAGPALLQSLGLDDSAEDRLEKLEQTLAQSYPGRESEALCDLYGMLAGARRQQKIAVRAVSLELLMRPPSAAERWAWQCIYARPWADVVRREEQRYQLPAGLTHAIMRQESAFSTEALSPVGAQGLMQLMPETARRAAREIQLDFDAAQIQRPDVNVRLGAFYLSKLLKSFGASPVLAAAAYNAGPHAVKRWLEATEEREADLWVARIPYRETRHYVQRVLGNYYRYQWLAGGSAAVTPLPLTLPSAIDVGADPY